MVGLTVLGISLQGEGGAPVLLLHPQGMDRILALSIGSMEAFAISSVLNAPEQGCSGTALIKEKAVSLDPDGRTETSAGGQPVFLQQEKQFRALFPRPQTHDLALQLMQTLDAQLLGVEILRMVDGVFIAEAVLSTGSTIVRVDCRPSDGVALAIRCGALLRATKSVLSYAEDMEEVLGALPEHVRLLARARMASSPSALQRVRQRVKGKKPAATVRQQEIPPALEAALAVSDKFRGKNAKGPWAKAAPDKKLSLNDPGEADSYLEIRPEDLTELLLEAAKPEPLEKTARDGKEEFKLLEDMEAEAADIRAATRVLKKQAESSQPKEKPVRANGGPSIRISLVKQKRDGQVEVLDAAEITARPATGEDRILQMRADAENAGLIDLDDDERWAALLRVLTPETKALM